ncbi:hypothetical protein JIM95_008850 [Corynebacterium sp. CCM 8835]|uniref:ATP synthase protein I n=1 Tax=Corynebacterium antarcticum TaxID=2800405 RepID=A0A9Q4GKZ2_9CORY|nr:hypothetical protein [Corynebacterium antarcticum]MCK7642994.1 hypothetical protein [Corynebacterium antarcticum]MCK7661497.1 hypothetical protein [Corynebacterium antarcticum]MCL0246240.1 hypothetical protein [Corynebacterium antarcticum]MCX7492491.1 hypothetical protein [Corynebacterium antarcticum]MCX7538402.1 hypothetical protein [Corynebacterium antarcticum]
MSETKQTPESQYDDHRVPLIRAARLGAVALVVTTLLLGALWTSVDGMPGLWGVLVGAGVGGGFLLMTVLSVLVTSGQSPSTTAAVVLGSWLLKLVVLLVVLFVLRNLDFYSGRALFTTVVVAIVAVIGSETWGIVRTRTTYVS